MAKDKKPSARPPGQPPLRLEWIEAGSLDENPLNWRRHPDNQMAALKDVLDDPEIGWAGACLWNERTKRLVDGHARRASVDPSTPIPVLIGSWSEEAEKKILLTLDPLAGLAVPDEANLRTLLGDVTFGQESLRGLAADLVEGLGAQGTPPKAGGDARSEICKRGDPKVKMVISVKDLADVEKALVLTGNMNRGEALVEICQSYAKGQLNVQAKGGTAA
jgi:hypothetical protein